MVGRRESVVDGLLVVHVRLGASATALGLCVLSRRRGRAYAVGAVPTGAIVAALSVPISPLVW